MNWEPQTPTARKEHVCQLCEWTIPPGDTYHRAVGIWEGEIWTYKAHAICHALIEWLDWFQEADGSPDPFDFRAFLCDVVSVQREVLGAGFPGTAVCVELVDYPQSDIGQLCAA